MIVANIDWALETFQAKNVTTVVWIILNSMLIVGDLGPLFNEEGEALGWLEICKKLRPSSLALVPFQNNSHSRLGSLLN